MDIYLTFDYELFFGEETGTVEKCLIQPTNDLLDLCERYSISMTFFVDVGFFYSIRKFFENLPTFIG